MTYFKDILAGDCFFITSPDVNTINKQRNIFKCKLPGCLSKIPSFFCSHRRNCNNSLMCGLIFQISLFYFCFCSLWVFAFNRKNAHCCPSTAIYLVMEENGDIRSPSDWGEPSPVHVCDGKVNLMPYLDILSVREGWKSSPSVLWQIVYFKAVKSSRGVFPHT